MPQVLGKYFFTTKKKLPIPVKIDVKAKQPQAPLIEAMNSTCLRTPSGPTCAVKIGRCDMTVEQLQPNADKVLPQVFAHFEKAGNEIKQVHVQATDAPALPVMKSVAPAAAPKKRKAEPAPEEDAEPVKAERTTLGDLAKKRRKA